MSAAALRDVAERADIVARAIEVARKCLDGDPFRRVPELAAEAATLFAEYDGAPIERSRGAKSAFEVAASALSTAQMAARRRTVRRQATAGADSIESLLPNTVRCFVYSVAIGRWRASSLEFDLAVEAGTLAGAVGCLREALAEFVAGVLAENHAGAAQRVRRRASILRHLRYLVSRTHTACLQWLGGRVPADRILAALGSGNIVRLGLAWAYRRRE